MDEVDAQIVELREPTLILLDDVQRTAKAGVEAFPHENRNLVRAVFASFEGIIYRMKQVAHTMDPGNFFRMNQDTGQPCKPSAPAGSLPAQGQRALLPNALMQPTNAGRAAGALGGVAPSGHNSGALVVSGRLQLMRNPLGGRTKSSFQLMRISSGGRADTPYGRRFTR